MVEGLKLGRTTNMERIDFLSMLASSANGLEGLVSMTCL